MLVFINYCSHDVYTHLYEYNRGTNIRHMKIWKYVWMHVFWIHNFNWLRKSPYLLVSHSLYSSTYFPPNMRHESRGGTSFEWLIDWLIGIWVRALTVTMYLGLINGLCVSHNLISALLLAKVPDGRQTTFNFLWVQEKWTEICILFFSLKYQ